MDGYVLRGVEDEYLLVVKSAEYELILQIIDRLAASRCRNFKELAFHLEKSLHDDDSRGSASETRSKNKTKNSNGNRGGRSKAADSQHRTKPRP